MIFFSSVYSQFIFHWKDRSLVIKQNHSKCAKVMGSKWNQNRPRCAVLAFMFQISYNAAKLCFSDSSSLVTSCVFTDKKEVDTWPINLSFQIKLAKKKHISTSTVLIQDWSCVNLHFTVSHLFGSVPFFFLLWKKAVCGWNLVDAADSFTARKWIFRSSESTSI